MALIEGHIEAGKNRIVAPPRPREGLLSLKNVLFATDFSTISEAAFPYATAICRHFGSMLHVAHVLSETSVLLMTGGVAIWELDQNETGPEVFHRPALEETAGGK